MRFEVHRHMNTGQLVLCVLGYPPDDIAYEFLFFAEFTPLDENGKEISSEEFGLPL